MGSSSYVAFLVIGTMLVLIDGQIIYRSGRRYMQQSASKAAAESLTKLVTVLFHLGTLGVLALLSTIDFPTDNQTKGLVLRFGIVLIILGIAHWIAVATLGRLRDREDYDVVNVEREARRQANDTAMQAQGPYAQEPTENPAYTGESVTAIVNRQNQHR